MQLIHKFKRPLFYGLWFLLLTLQALMTELSPDEAYYWMYSRELDWGYFDHPPLIAVLVKAGYGIFPNEFGVRLFPIIFSCLGIFLLEKIVRPKRFYLFVGIVSSIGLMHFLGFLATPDAPLLFFSVLTLFLYQSFLKQQSWILSILLAFSIALLFLSKYHAFIFIGLILLSNLQLLKTKYFWALAIICMTLVSPHLLWQIENGFPSISYHLFERSSPVYSFGQTAEFVGTQVFLFAPIVGFFFFFHAAKFKAQSTFERGLQFLFWGFYIFFFLMTFKGRVEGHWTILVVWPAIYFSYKYLESRKTLHTVFPALLLVSLLLIAVARFLVAVDLQFDKSHPISKATKNFFHKTEIERIESFAQDAPVAFMNSYKAASLYTFYTQKESFSLNNGMGRKNQFDLWQSEDRFRGQRVLLLPNYTVDQLEKIPGFGEQRYAWFDNFQVFSQVRIEAHDLPETILCNDSLDLQVSLLMEKSYDFESNLKFPARLSYQFFKRGKLVKQKWLFRLTNEKRDSPQTLKIQAPKEPGTYQLALSISVGWLPASFNSKRMKVKVECAH